MKKKETQGLKIKASERNRDQITQLKHIFSLALPKLFITKI